MPSNNALDVLMRADQRDAVLRGILVAVPVNMFLGLVVTLVSIHTGHARDGVLWLAFSSLVNIVRMTTSFVFLRGKSNDTARVAVGPVEWHLRLSSITALASGGVWAFVPLLCHAYTGADAVFYLTVVCGTTAGAVVSSTAYARMPLCFITPPLLSAAGCLLFYQPGFVRDWLAVTVLLYLVGLAHIARQAEQRFRAFSSVKNEATVLAQSLSRANEQATSVARQMRYRATHDQLTGLLNRAGFIEAVEASAAVGHPPFCLMILDLDGFKSVNDMWGHRAGDQVLTEIAERFRKVLVGPCVVARIGGDEFAIFCRIDASAPVPSALASSLIAAMELPFVDFDPGRLGVSIGIHVTETFDLTAMLTCADEAMYAAKRAGRNRYYLFDDCLRQRLDIRLDIERDLKAALDNHALDVWYQPVFGDDSERPVNLEALIRWQHPKHGWIAPEDLIASASRVGLSGALLRYIFDDVCDMIETLRGHGFEHVWVAMNISPRELAKIPFDELLPAILHERGLPTAMLEIEITEETPIDEMAVQKKLRALLDAGVRVAIDDFGAGYSSLAVLQRIQVNRIKIDRSFVTGLHGSTNQQILVQTILKLGYALCIDVVAEGVETEADLLMLRSFGCRLMQGYYLRRPAPREAVLDWMLAVPSPVPAPVPTPVLRA